MPDETNSDNIRPAIPVTVRIFPGVAYLTITQDGQPKRIQTDRRGLETIRDALTTALDNPLSNRDGKHVRNVLD